MSPLIRSAVLLGVVMGVYSIAAVYLVVSFLPEGFGVLIPIGALLIPIVVQWPHWFDRGPDGGWMRRLLRRLGLVACAAPIGAVVALFVVTAVPGYFQWTDDMHRQSLVRQGRPPAEIESTIAAHRGTRTHTLVGGAILTAIPGTIGALVTTAASAVVWRRRTERAFV
jgi:hypothetical protein